MAERPDEDRAPRAALNKAGCLEVTVSCVVVALGLLAALLAQGGLFSADPGLPDHPDGLTTLALVLAILAFLVQMFVFVFQSNASRASVQRSEELNAETHMALGKIEANSSATQKVLFAQFDRLLDYVVGPATEHAGGAESAEINESLDAEEMESDAGDSDPATVADVQRIVGEMVRPRDRPAFGGIPLNHERSAEDLRVVRYLQGWPSREELESAVADLAKLPPLALAVLTRYGTMEVVQRLEGKQVGLTRGKVQPEVTRRLIEAGLVRENDNLATLTDRGRELVRALPIGKPLENRPEWYEEALRPLLDES